MNLVSRVVLCFMFKKNGEGVAGDVLYMYRAEIKVCNFYSEVCYLIVGYENKSMVLCL